MLTAHEPSIKPLANIVSCYICSDRQYKRKNTFHFSHLPSRINGRARPQTHYTTRFAKKIQETMHPAKASPFGSNGDDRRQWRKQGGAVGAAASRMRAAAKQTLGAATRAVSPEATERASPARKSRRRSDRQALCQSDTIAAPVILGQQPCPLSRACARQLSQRGSLCLRGLREFVENARLKRKEFVNVIKMRRRY